MLRVLKRPGDATGLARLRTFLDEIDGRLGVPTSVIETIAPAGRYTIERRLAGTSLLTLLPPLHGTDRRKAITAYVEGAEATGRLALPDHPYGQILAPSPLTAESWTGYFRLSLDFWLAQNGTAIAEATGDGERVHANAAALVRALP